MGAKHITAQEKELFQVLTNTGLSIRKVARLTGRTAGTVSDHLAVSESKQVISKYLTEDEMFTILDLRAQGMTCTDIGVKLDKAHGTIYKVIHQTYPKHKKAYAKWIELQKQEESPALVMEVQTVETDVVPSPCKHQLIINTQREIIEKQKSIIANHEETINFLKEHIQLLKSLR